MRKVESVTLDTMNNSTVLVDCITESLMSDMQCNLRYYAATTADLKKHNEVAAFPQKSDTAQSLGFCSSGDKVILISVSF